jgi:dihydrofolate reductase
VDGVDDLAAVDPFQIDAGDAEVGVAELALGDGQRDAREPIEMEGGTSFHFVTQGFEAAYAQARETAGGDGVDIAGGASTVRQALAAGVIDELTLDVAPVVLGSGERLFDGIKSFEFEPVEVLHSPIATHIRYRREK